MTALVVCRSASDPRRPGSVLGYQCRLCGLELAVSPTGVEQIAHGGVPLCNPCGFSMTVKANAKGEIAALVLNPAAQEQILRREQEKAGRN